MNQKNQELRNDPRYQNHDSRPDLAGEHPKGDAYQLAAFLIFVGALLVDYFVLGNLQRNYHLVPIEVRLFAALLLSGTGGWLAFRGIHEVFSEYREEPVILTGGLFSHMRHPIYLGAILFYIAALVLSMSPLGLVVFIGVLILYQWLALYEEQRMLAVFGRAYENYRQRVPMWLPIKIK